MPMPAFSVAPMPEPVSRYQPPESAAASIPAARHSRSSALWVPLSSPRDANGARTLAILASAAGVSVMPAMRAGSACGPTITKSLYIASARARPWPSATNFSSASRSWTSSASPSPLAALRIAWPVPTATTRTSIPVLARNTGRMRSNRPEFRVEVVDWRTMNCAAAGLAATSAATKARTSARRVIARRGRHRAGLRPRRGRARSLARRGSAAARPPRPPGRRAGTPARRPACAPGRHRG